MHVAIGMSGGVDSSVAAFLLKEAGYQVMGLFMKNWDDEEDHCPYLEDYEEALSVCQKLKIPLYSIDLSQKYWDHVFTHFLKDLKQGNTPNPDILCNREIKFHVFLKKALALGAEKLATGHYARISKQSDLLKSLDKKKDQSYFLYTLKKSLLKKVLFPIGNYQKEDIRKLAKQIGLPNHDKKDSTGICFIGKRNFSHFIKKYLPPLKKGLFLTPQGTVVGEHDGAWYFTIGQRKGLNIGGPGKAWFVVDKDISTHTVTVVQGENHPLLFSQSLLASDLSWVTSPPTLPYSCKAKIRYRQKDQACLIETIEKGVAFVSFSQPQRAITPKQAIVFYQGNVCLGGGLIIKSCK